MMRTGERAGFLGKEVVVLLFHENEVLIFIDQRNIKWVDKAMLDLPKPA